ncbi:hypothetical protein ACVRY7_06650 [Streptococcus ictaluri]|nr:hypothetical protein [Streptococcus ictaluri]
MALLDYSLDQPDHGINCLSKSKILQECLLALGIPARRMHLMPFGPYDLDCHVVVELFDDQLQKWIMLDPTSDTYCVNEQGLPLDLLEMREAFEKGQEVTILVNGRPLKKSDQRMLKSYYAKNLFYLKADCHQTVDFDGEMVDFRPSHFDITSYRRANLKYRYQTLKNMPEVEVKLLEEAKKAMETFVSDDSKNVRVACLKKGQPMLAVGY